MTVILKELERCSQILPNLDGELKEAMEGRIEILQFAKESIESDIANDMLDEAQYLKQVQEYYEEECANYIRAKKEGLDEENLQLIKERIDTVKEEIDGANQHMSGQQEEANVEAMANSEVVNVGVEEEKEQLEDDAADE